MPAPTATCAVAPCSARKGAAACPDQLCWICLDGGGDLVNPCACPADRVVHKTCLARWQLQSAGKSEEHCCRFCGKEYPSWKDSLTPQNLQPATPVVSVHYNGVCHKIRVKPGPDGFESFQRQLHHITGLPELDCMQITFQCRAPGSAQELNFAGISAFDAAIHCASISAAERQQRPGRGSLSRDRGASHRVTGRRSDESTSSHGSSTISYNGSLASSLDAPEPLSPHPELAGGSDRAASGPRALLDESLPAVFKRMPRLRAFAEFVKSLFMSKAAAAPTPGEARWLLE
mmetsp:Transcript_65251/g.143019  ORF Transcript_65251/g.143019 Transcript_65251/m.143019 type:complete len:289 (-) Transcript_65251:435-1301(-)